MLFSILSPVLAAGAAVTPVDAQAAFAAWQSQRGASWRVFVDPKTHYPEMIAGGRAEMGPAPRDEREAATIAESALHATRAITAVEPSTLELVRALFVPLGQIGSGDKWTLQYRQVLSGVPVEDAFLNVLLDADGRLLSVQSTAVPAQDALDAVPSLDGETAALRARAAFVRGEGATPTHVSDATLGAVRVESEAGREARLAWLVDVDWQGDDALPIGRRYAIDARDGSVLASDSTVHSFDLTGTVTTKATPGLAPDTAANPATTQSMKYVRVTAGSTTVYADASGNFTVPGIASPTSVTFGYAGQFVNVTNNAGAAHTITQTLTPGVPATIALNPAPTEQITAQANAYRGVNALREFVRATNPSDATADIVFQANVNQSSTCNAFYTTGSINFFASGGGCVNSAYSTVVNHEQGHWMNVIYNTTNSSDGMGEGNADVWAMYVWDNPVVAQDFFGVGAPIRTGLNTQHFCGDLTPGCYGETHANGEPWMGAAWKVRARLESSYGAGPGALIANSIFLGWMEGYDQQTVRSIIETQWLTLDDNDGNLNNGTPHFSEIDGGFRDQLFPGVTLVPLAVSNVTELADTENTAGPYSVSANVSANFSPPVTGVTLNYSVSGGPYTPVAMTPTGGGNYTASIPGQVYPAIVRYYVSASDSGGRTATWPSSAPQQAQAFDLGTFHLLRADTFEGSSTWTTGSVGDTSNPENDWVRTTPTGLGGSVGSTSWRDPSAAAQGTVCYGNDLNSDGAYSANVHSYLRSPTINCSSATNTRLRFKSWLTIDGNLNDQARVIVNGVQFYMNPAAPRIDTGWGMQELDISSVADHASSVTVEFQLKSDATGNFGGWSVDDVKVFYLTPIVVPCAPPVGYCTGAPNSVGPGAVVGYFGTGNLVLNNLNIQVYQCPPNTTGLFFYGPNQINAPFGNGVRCVGGSVHRFPTQTTDGSGITSRALNWNAMPGGTPSPGDVLNFQFWYRNPAAGGAGFNLSNALSVTICP